MVAALAALALAVPPPTYDTVPVFITPPGYSVELVEQDDVVGATPAKLAPELRVFHESPRMSDILPYELRFFARNGYPQRSRLLLATRGTRIYAYPDDRGDVCVLFAPLAGGNCVPGLLHGATVSVRSYRSVWGLLSNAAERVDVRLGSRVVRAHIGRNVFYVRLPRDVAAPRSVVVHDHDGALHVYVIRACSIESLTRRIPVYGPLDPPC